MTTYEQRVRRLWRRGLPLRLARQLRECGPDCLPQVVALEAATPAQIAALSDYNIAAASSTTNDATEDE